MPAKKILMLVGDYSEDYEVMVPYQMLLMVGHHVDVVCPNKKKGDHIKTAVHDFENDQTYSEKIGHNFILNQNFDDVNPSSYDALVIPGGRAPEYLRNNSKVLEITSHFVKSNLPIATICHGSQILCAVKDSMKGKKVTAYPALKHDIENVGGVWQDRCVGGAVVDGNLITAYAWPDHPGWIASLLKLLGTQITP